MAQTEYNWECTLGGDFRPVHRAGYLSIVLFISVFVSWAATIPISGAIIVPGVIAANGRNVVVQHLESGIVRAIHATEGDRIARGSPLIELDSTQAEIELRRLNMQWAALTAMAAQLKAERDGLEMLAPVSFDFCDLDASSSESLIREQKKEFEARLHRYQSERAILRQREATLKKGLSGLKAQEAALEEQLTIVADELARKRELVEQGLTSHFEYTQIQKSQSDLIGQMGVIKSEIAANEIQIVEAREQIERLASKRVEEAVTRLNETRTSLADIEERIVAARAVLDRMVIRAPTSGIVVSATYNSPGSVISPGEKLFEILPTMDELVIEARLRPQDIDAVRIGQTARLRLSALNNRMMPEVAGEVMLVSADRLLDQVTGESYYRVKLKISDNLPPDVSFEQLYHGAPVEVFIDTGKRTFLQYLVRPLLDSLSKSFREE